MRSPAQVHTVARPVAPARRRGLTGSTFYESLPATLDKAYLELRGARHFAPNTSNTTIARQSIAWLKRYVDDDLRYAQFLCPAPTVSTAISEYRSTCAA